MTFEKAFDLAYDKAPHASVPKGDNNYAKLLAFMWSILAEAKDKDGKIVLDDMAFIDENQNIVSIPLQKSSTKKTAGKPKAPKKPKVEKKPDETKVEADVKETEKESTTADTSTE